jgi:hypothetical protein
MAPPFISFVDEQRVNAGRFLIMITPFPGKPMKRKQDAFSGINFTIIPPGNPYPDEFLHRFQPESRLKSALIYPMYPHE